MNQPREKGGYALEWRLGSGAFSVVWKGRHTLTKAVAALKIVKDEVGSTARKLFRREARAVSLLAHPHIVPVFDHGPDYLAVAFIEGRSLALRLEEPLTPAEAIRVTLQVGSALEHAHGRGVIHRDVKPANVMLDRHDNAFLMDFGMALLPGEDAARAPRGGTSRYMAPEQIGTTSASGSADQYALARTLVELLGGDLDRPQDDLLAQLPNVVRERLDVVLRRALHQDPNARWPSIAAFVKELAAVTLDDVAAAETRAPVLRSSDAFTWCGSLERRALLTPQIERVDYSLSRCTDWGSLAPRVAEAQQRETGLKELTWSLYGRRDRLGPLDEPTALARARQVVVMMSGLLYPRSIWQPLAEALCRDNPLTVVLAPDWMGWGGSRFADDAPTVEQVSPLRTIRSLLSFLETLGVHELPRVLVAHSAAATPVMMLSDDDLGEHTSRLVIAPIFPFANAAWRKRVQPMKALAVVAQWTPWLLTKALQRDLGIAMKHLDAGLRKATLEAAEEWPLRASRAFAHQLLDGRPQTSGHGLKRCTVLAATDDPYITRDVCDAALRSLGFNLANRHWCVTDTHYPHLPDTRFPERTARNLDQLIRLINGMLLDAREGVTETSSSGAPVSSATSEQAAVADTVLSGRDEATQTHTAEPGADDDA